MRQPEEGLSVLAEALAAVDNTGERLAIGLVLATADRLLEGN